MKYHITIACISEEISVQFFKFFVPVNKSGNNNYIKNYRPISVNIHSAKILLHLITEKSFVHKGYYINPNQYGFYKKHSVITRLISFAQKVL